MTLRAAAWYFFPVPFRALGQWLAIVIVLTLLFGEIIRVRRKHALPRPGTPAASPARR